MRFFLQVLLIALTGFLLEWWLPWWSVSIAGALGGYILRSKANFLAGFVGIAILWYVVIWRIETLAAADLASQVAAIFNNVPKNVLLVITCLLGGLTGGLASYTASLLRKPKPQSKYRY